MVVVCGHQWSGVCLKPQRQETEVLQSHSPPLWCPPLPESAPEHGAVWKRDQYLEGQKYNSFGVTLNHLCEFCWSLCLFAFCTAQPWAALVRFTVFLAVFPEDFEENLTVFLFLAFPLHSYSSHIFVWCKFVVSTEVTLYECIYYFFIVPLKILKFSTWSVAFRFPAKNLWEFSLDY